MASTNGKKKQIHMFSLAALGDGISGGDRIFIELARRWSKNSSITIHVWEEGYEMCKRQKLSSHKTLKFVNYDLGFICRLGFVVCYLARIILGAWVGLTLRLSINEGSPIILYSSSEFWMDSLPVFLLKIRFGKRVQWVAAWYQTAPNPLKGFAEGTRGTKYRIRAFAYWFMQLPIKPLVERYADKVIVNNEDEKKQFPKHTKSANTIVLIGAVPLEDIKRYHGTKSGTIDMKKYDAVFQGRFHPQKGVEELVDIWKRVVTNVPNAKLAMIGDGPLMQSVKFKIKNEKLENNIILFGYLYDGPKKYDIFSKSKLVVHPAFYDSGGMASAEAMAFGIPCVGFDLKSYESYYPKGMIKVKTGDTDAFANAIITLLKDNKERKKIGYEAHKMIESYWSWDKRADNIFQEVIRS